MEVDVIRFFSKVTKHVSKSWLQSILDHLMHNFLSCLQGKIHTQASFVLHLSRSLARAYAVYTWE